MKISEIRIKGYASFYLNKYPDGSKNYYVAEYNKKSDSYMIRAHKLDQYENAYQLLFKNKRLKNV